MKQNKPWRSIWGRTEKMRARYISPRTQLGQRQLSIALEGSLFVKSLYENSTWQVRERDVLTLEWMLKTLLDLGFKQQDDEVCMFLVLNGPRRTRDKQMLRKPISAKSTAPSKPFKT